MPSHLLNQHNWIRKNKLQWNFNQSTKNFSFTKMHLKISSAIWRSFLPVEYDLIHPMFVDIYANTWPWFIINARWAHLLLYFYNRSWCFDTQQWRVSMVFCYINAMVNLNWESARHHNGNILGMHTWKEICSLESHIWLVSGNTGIYDRCFGFLIGPCRCFISKCTFLHWA